jgi:hypothetical protein
MKELRLMTRERTGNLMNVVELESMAIEMPPVAGHPNRVGFRGVLTLVDVPSDKAPAGARGHRVVLTRAAAERALASLLGMGVDYAPTLDRHDVRRKVGVITRAEIVGRNLELGGHLFARDFPDVVREMEKAGGAGRSAELAGAARRSSPGSGEALGMSYEIADARVEDVRAEFWILTSVTFTGAAILRREKAAYQRTWVELGE